MIYRIKETETGIIYDEIYITPMQAQSQIEEYLQGTNKDNYFIIIDENNNEIIFDSYNQIEALYRNATGEARKAYSKVLDIICENTQIHPTGYWIFESGKIPKCSICGRYSDDADEYGDAICCPFCGSKMKYIR